MCLRIHKWLAVNAHKKIINWILEGVPLFLTSVPSRCELPNRVFSPAQACFVDCEIQQLLQADSIRVVPCERAHCILPISVVAKKGGKFRLVLDSRHTNSWISCPSFKQEGLDVVSTIIEPEDFLISVDLKNGFHHLQVRPDQRRFLCFQWKGTCYQWCVLPFGVKSAPYLFSRTVKEVVHYVREQGVRCSVWVDDFIFCIKPRSFDRDSDWILSEFSAFGWTVNLQKCDLTPTTETMFIRFHVFSVGPQGPWVHVPLKKIHVLQKLLRSVLKEYFLSARKLA